MKKKIIHYFNQGARTYDAAAELQIHVAKQLAMRLQPVSANTILEIGCGTGLLSQHLVSLFPHSSFLLTDIAPVMVETCRERFKQYPRIQTSCQDGEALNLNSKFDMIISSMTMHWFQDFENSFRKLQDLLMPGGKIIFALLGNKSLHEWNKICEAFNAVAAKCNSNYPDPQWMKSEGLEVVTEIVKQTYENSHAFLRSLKCLGARATQEDYQSIAVNQMRKLFKTYSNEIQITYEIIYGCYTKS